MRRFRALAMRRIGPFDRMLVRIFLLVGYTGLVVGAWWQNKRVSVYYCSDDIVAQGKPCPGIDTFVDLHAGSGAVFVMMIAALFIVPVPIYVIVSVCMICIVFVVGMYFVWAADHAPDVVMYASEAWKVSVGGGIVANSALAAGLLGYLIFLIIVARRK